MTNPKRFGTMTNKPQKYDAEILSPFRCRFPARQHDFVLISMYGFPVALDRRTYCMSKGFYFFTNQTHIHDPEAHINHVLHNQQVLKDIARKNAARKKPQTWLRHGVYQGQPEHLSDLEFYKRLHDVLSEWVNRQALTPKTELDALFALETLKK